MKRRLLTIASAALSALSGLLLLATAIAIAVSCTLEPSYALHRGRLTLAGGLVTWATENSRRLTPEELRQAAHNHPPFLTWHELWPLSRMWHALGIWAQEESGIDSLDILHDDGQNVFGRGTTTIRRRYSFRLWLPLALFVILPFYRTRRWLKKLQRDSRRRRGLCPVCSYDLRSSPERCPECGAAVPQDMIQRR